MLNDLTRHKPCIITTNDGDAISGLYVGVETRHGDWAVLIRQNAHTLSIPVESIRAAVAPVGAQP